MTNETDYISKWQEVLTFMRQKLGRSTFETWFSKVEYHAASKGKMELFVNGFVAKGWIASRYLSVLEAQLSARCGEPMQLILLERTRSELPQLDLFPPAGFSGEEAIAQTSKFAVCATSPSLFNALNPHYTFETFVVGESNQFAHTACVSVAENPSYTYNPLYIYGGVGLGKTHLMHAIGHKILQNNPTLQVLYVSCEQFANDFITAIREDRTAVFRNQYRSCDVLMIDDIQFLAGKERTQEELFHTFNELYNSNKQVIVSSDCPPKMIPKLTERLRSRFEWGLITNVYAPDYETRIAILKQKAQTHHWQLDNETLRYIATHMESNIRELEGALTRLNAYTKAMNKPINVITAAESFQELLPKAAPSKQVDIDTIQQEVCSYYQISLDDLHSRKRSHSLVQARQVAMYLCRELTSLSLLMIGNHLGGRNHSTIMHGIEKIEQEMEKDPEIKQILQEIRYHLQVAGDGQ